MFLAKYFAPRYFAERYFPGASGEELESSGVDYFPAEYFAERYFPARYFPAPASEEAEEAEDDDTVYAPDIIYEHPGAPSRLRRKRRWNNFGPWPTPEEQRLAEEEEKEFIRLRRKAETLAILLDLDEFLI